ncbi:MAG: hypothetical protein IPO92_06520 [Saprospiraceae bacterium]|nr:hypothetical protein [Saprospiraceae bacterium]
MIKNLKPLYSGIDSLNALDVPELEALVLEYPFSDIYRMVLANKLEHKFANDISITAQDRIFMEYLFNQGATVPNINDVKFYNQSQSEHGQSKQNETNDRVVLDQIISEVSVTGESTFDLSVEEENTTESPVLNVQNVSNSIMSPEMDAINQKVKTEKLKTHKKFKQEKFKLKEFSGISDFSLWLLSFKSDDLDKRIKKEEKAAKKKLFEDNAKKSVTRSPSIISEPLAEILASQGHLDDSKKMYEQLMLKYPEKSSYFAAKINNLIKI